ncbi:hypothetical protein RUM44_009890 [Polyplax serrata]|uniref:C2H2-type domain-containing protein n=1 Tax=Polyplax serrata TaxID=468196 RepID=A0ABR1AVH2_POLSC
MTDSRYSRIFSGLNYPHEYGSGTHNGSDCERPSCGRNYTHFHCRSCGYGTSQAANINTHTRLCTQYNDLQPKDFTRLTPSSDTNMLQHDILQQNQSYSYFSSVGPSVVLPSQCSPNGMNHKLITTQQSGMFNFVMPPQSAQYGTLYGSQTTFSNPNLFSPPNFNNYGQLDTSWLPQSRLMPTSVHSLNVTPDLGGNGKSSYEKLDPSNSPSCWGRYSAMETTAIGMCSPLTAEAYKIVTKELQAKLDAKNWYSCSPSKIKFNCQTEVRKCTESVPSCSISLLLLENDQKHDHDCGRETPFECCKTDERCDINHCIKKDSEQGFTECIKDSQIEDKFHCNEKDINNGSISQNMNKEVIECDIIHDSSDEIIELKSPSRDSDIIVEESSNSEQILSSTKSDWNSKCLVCRRCTTDDSVKLSSEKPVTAATHKSVVEKLTKVLNDDRFHEDDNNSICSRCLDLVNIVDQLETKLNSAKKELLDIYNANSNKESIICDAINNNSQEKSVMNSCKSKLICDVCHKTFSSMNYLEKHKQCHTKAFSYYCEYCGKGFAVLQTLQNHVNLHSKSSKYQCELCGKKFIQKPNLTDHLRKHKGEYRYKCPVCHKAFIRRSVLKVHVLAHKSESHMCQYCGKQFKNLTNLTVHIKICSGDLKFCCDKCDKKFPIRSLLKRHISIRHNSEYLFVCSICSKGFGKNSDLRTHMRSHSDKKPFRCSKCNNCYKSLSNLNQHMKVHSTGASLECTICSKKFTRQDCLTDHLNQHTGDKPYKCMTCLKAFANRINFNIHVKRHNGTLKKKACPICGKLFNKGLKDHMTSHSGEKPYSCKQCLAVFTVKSSLNKHVKLKHDLM